MIGISSRVSLFSGSGETKLLVVVVTAVIIIIIDQMCGPQGSMNYV